MQCNELRNLLDELLDEQLPLPARAEAQAHLSVCAECSQELELHRQYRRQLAQFSVPEPDAGHYALLLRQARIQGEERQGEEQQRDDNTRKHRIQGFLAASLLACAVLAAMTLNPAGQSGADLMAQQADVAQEEITVLINVPADMLGATLALEFPAELRLQGFDNASRLAWPVDLKQGANAITLPVVASHSLAHGQTLLLSAAIEYNNKSKRFQLPVELFSPHKAGYESVPVHSRQPIISI